MDRNAFLAALCALAAACGGSKGIDPDKVTFAYPAGAPVLAGSPEADAVGAGEVGAQQAQALPAEGDPVAATSRADSIVTLADAVAGACMGSSTGLAVGLAAPGSDRAGVELRAAAFAAGEVEVAAAGFDDPGCVTVAPGAITYARCRQTVVDPAGGTSVVSVDGTITRAVAAGSATAAWDVRVRLDSTDGQFTMSVASRYTGGFTLEASAIAGRSRSDAAVNVSVPGMAVSAEVTHLADYDLAFATGPFCVTDGSLEVRRVWTRRPAGLDPAETRDLGVQITWEGCGLARVAWGARN